MKIAILTPSFLPKVGGAQVFSYNIARQLALTGNTVHTYVPEDNFRALNPKFRELLRPLPRKFYGVARRVPWLGLRWAGHFLSRKQREERYDGWLVVATTPSGYVAATLHGKVPLVLRGSGEDIQKAPELDYGLRLSQDQERRISRTVRSCDKLIALTESVRSDFLELGVSNEDIAIIPNGVDLEWFKPDRDVGELRAELNWPRDRPVILTTGRHHRKKGFNLIPAIAELLRDQGLKFQWFLVGLGVDRLDEEIRARGLGDDVKTHGEVGVSYQPGQEWRFPDKKLVMMYQAADIYAFPSLLETFGMVQLEAMAAGAVVVSTDAPGCRDVVQHEENGLQAQAGDVESFARQLERVISNPELRADLSHKAQKFVQGYAWARVARQYEDVFQELIEKR